MPGVPVMVVRGADYPRKADEFYITPAETTRALLDTYREFGRRICDPCCGDGAILNMLNTYHHKTGGNDISQGYHFLTDPFPWTGYDIVTNPPYGSGGRMAFDFITRALAVTA